MTPTTNQKIRFESDLNKMAGEALEFRWMDNEITAIGSELAILRIHLKYNRHSHNNHIVNIGEAKGLADGRWFLVYAA